MIQSGGFVLFALYLFEPSSNQRSDRLDMIADKRLVAAGAAVYLDFSFDMPAPTQRVILFLVEDLFCNQREQSPTVGSRAIAQQCIDMARLIAANFTQRRSTRGLSRQLCRLKVEYFSQCSRPMRDVIYFLLPT